MRLDLHARYTHRNKESVVPAYVLTHLTVTDPEGFARFSQGVPPLTQRHRGRLLVADAAAKPLEGGYADGLTIVVEFPSAADAQAWYDSVEYQELSVLRRAATETHSMVILHATPEVFRGDS